MRPLLAIAVFWLLPAAALAAPKPPLDSLFAQLAEANSPEDAKPLESRIGAIFLQSGSASVDLLMTRAGQALGDADKQTATRLLEAVTRIAPHYAEGWHRMGELELASGDDAGAMMSLQKSILLNPRQFGAMDELADMLEQYGDKAGALKLYRHVLALDPQMDGVARHVQQLSHAVEGQGI